MLLLLLALKEEGVPVLVCNVSLLVLLLLLLMSVVGVVLLLLLPLFVVVMFPRAGSVVAIEWLLLLFQPYGKTLLLGCDSGSDCGGGCCCGGRWDLLLE